MKRIKSTQNLLEILDIQDGILILKNNCFAKILNIQPINFGLKSESEKEIIIDSYRKFLKTCNFDFQIIVKTKKENTNSHLKIISKQENVPNRIKEQYIDYINELANSKYIFLKSFYLIYSIKQDNIETLNKVEKELDSKYNLIKDCLGKCGNYVQDLSEYGDEKLCKLISSFINERESLYEFY